MKKQPLLDILSASFAAYRINGDYYKETRRFQESPTQFSNKDCLVNQFATEYFPPDWQPMTVTDTDMENAIESVKWINKEYAMQIIADSLTDYMKNLINCLNTKELSMEDFGIVAVTPKIYFEGVKKKSVKKTLKDSFKESKHISTIGSVFEGAFTLHEIKFVDKYTCHVLNGSHEGKVLRVCVCTSLQCILKRKESTAEEGTPQDNASTGDMRNRHILTIGNRTPEAEEMVGDKWNSHIHDAKVEHVGAQGKSP